MPPTTPVLLHILDANGNIVAVRDGGGELPVLATPVLPAAVVHFNSVVTVAAASTLALAENANREYAAFINDSDETIYLSTDGTAAALNDGIRLNANGGSYEMSLLTGSLTTENIYAICASGSKKLLVTYGS